MTLSIMALDAKCCYAHCHLCWVTFVLSVASKLNMLSVIMLSAVMPSVIILNVVAPQNRMLKAYLHMSPISH